MFKNFLACFYEWKCQVEMYEMLQHNIKIHKQKEKNGRVPVKTSVTKW